MAVADFGRRCEALCAVYRHLWVRWILGHDELCVCGLEDVGELPAPGASLYDGENWYRGSPRFEPPGVRQQPARRESVGAVRDGDGMPPTADAPDRRGGGGGSGGGLRDYSMQYALPRDRIEELLAALGHWARHGGEGALCCSAREVELKFIGGPGSVPYSLD